MSGILQTQGSCWFYGILNELILSYDLGRLLYKHIEFEFARMSPDEREFFMSSVRAPCPLGTQFKKIYFYKFLDQYFCTHGPGQYLKKAGKSLSLVRRVSLAGSAVRRVQQGSYPNKELPSVLKTLGISYTIFKKPPSTANTELCVIAPGPTSWIDITSVPLSVCNGKYRLAAASIVIRNKNMSRLHSAHALAATIDAAGKGHVFDSASGLNLSVNWTKPDKLKYMIDTYIAPRFDSFSTANGTVTITDYGFSHLIYVNKLAVKGVVPVCRLNRVRKSPEHNLSYMYIPFFKHASSLVARLNTDMRLGLLTAADKRKIIKKFLEKKQESPKIKGNLSIVRNILMTNKSRASIERYLNTHFTFSPQNKKEINKFLENKFKINSLARAKGSVDRLKTMKARKEYLKKTTLVGTNLATLKKYIASRNNQQRAERELKRAAKK